MRAKFINENIKDFFKSKTKEEIKLSRRGREDSLKSYKPYTSNKYFLFIFGLNDQEKLRKFSLRFFPFMGALNSDGSMMSLDGWMEHGEKFFTLVSRFSPKKYVGRLDSDLNTIDAYDDMGERINDLEEIDNIIKNEFNWVKKQILEAYEPKDLKRVKDFAKKSGGDYQKEIAFAQRMANTLTNMDKAIGRAEAAAEVYGEQNEIVEIFYNKAKELGFTGPAPGERLEGGIKLGSQLPIEQQFKRTNGRPYEQRYNRSYRHRAMSRTGNAILPLGKVDLRSGDSPMFNVYDTWLGDSEITVEVWRDNKGINTKHLESPKELTGVFSILKPKSQEEVKSAKRKFFNYKVLFTSGSTPLYEIGEKQSFYHDQNGNNIGDWEMVDYVSLKDLKELILPYGKKISGYVYK